MRHFLLSCVAFLLFLSSSISPFSVEVDSSLELSLSHSQFSQGSEGYIYMSISMPQGWHTYYKDPGEVGAPLKLTWSLPEGVTLGAIDWPEPHTFFTAGIKSWGYRDSVILRVPVSFSKTVEDGAFILEADADWLVCKDSCIPVEQHVQVSAVVGPELVVNDFAPVFSFAAKMSAWVVLFYAFLGGIILNVMPCVLPVLSLKALDLISSADQEQKKKRWNALLYASGVVGSFLLLGGILMSLKAFGLELGWGFHLQSPIFVGILVVLMFVVGLNVWGAFELPLWIQSKLSLGGKDRSHFMTGVLATLVATPCTAPFMAPALGVALTLPSFIGVWVFVSLGLGLALPYVLLSLSPRFQKLLPKPGAWMLSFKKILAVPMFLTAIWLGWVFVSLIGVDQVGRHDGAQMYSEQVLNDAIRENKTVLVDVTADWCVTCLVNEKGVLNTEDTQALFKEKGVAVLVADWTARDDSITKYLESFGRNGVPLYVLYKPGESPRVLPQVLTKKIIKDAVGGDDKMGTDMKKATFAGGCFWCVVAPFKSLPGVESVVVGFTGGHLEAPSYQDVVNGGTGHFEAVQVTYDAAKTSYDDILEVFWRQIDPTDAYGQFADKGEHYRTAVFYHDEEQKRLAEDSKVRFDESGIFSGPIVTLILENATFYPAEEYHQDYYQKNPFRYESYKEGSGRKNYVDNHPLDALNK